MPKGEHLHTWFVLLGCMLLGAAVYGNTLDVPYYLDDYRNILENSHLHLTELSFDALREAVLGGTLKTRPVANLSFALNYYFGQESVFGYHLFNIIIHILSGFFLYQLASTTLSTPVLKGKYQNESLLAALAAFLWLVHPLHTQTVTYIVQRMNGLAVMFYILSIWLYGRGRMTATAWKWTFYFGSLTAGLLAMGSKEIAATLPFFIVLYEWFFFQKLDRRWLLRRIWIVSILVLFAGLLFLIYTDNPLELVSRYERRPFTLGQRLLTEPRVVLLYISLLFFPDPTRLNLDHQMEISHSLISPFSTLISLAAIIILLGLAIAGARKQPLLSFAVLWFFGNLVIESTFLNLELIFEHRTYLPSVFIIFALAAFVSQKVRPRWLGFSLLIAAIGICSWWTVQRNSLWRDPVEFWADSAAKSPGKARPFINLSAAYRDRGELDKAVESAETAIRVDPRFVNGFVVLGTAYLDRGEYDQAISAFREALRRIPDYAAVYNSLAKAYLAKGMVDAAAAALRENLRLDPKSYEALVNLATIKASRGQYREAIADFLRALGLKGPDPDILFNLALAYTESGQRARAIETYRQILEINPADREAAANLRELLSAQKSPGRY